MVSNHHPLHLDLLQAQLPEWMQDAARDQDLNTQVNVTHAITTTMAVAPHTSVILSTYAVSASGHILHRAAQDVTTRGTVLTDFFNPVPENVFSPVNVDRLEFYLDAHPDRDLVSYIITGFRFGFDIGFQGSVTDTRPRNLLTARSNPEPVSEAIRKELSRSHTAGPFSSPPMFPFHCSPLGAVPKKDGTFRIILDLSSPRGFSVNEGILKDTFSVRYSSFDDAVELVRLLGPSTFMAKLDIRHAFRLCPVRPDQWCLLGYCWEGNFFFDTCLPFGSRSSPFIFNTFANLLLWILIVYGGIQCIIHYLDDFFLCAASRQECQSNMDTMVSLFSELGIPLADDKTVGPAQSVTYLGIEIDAEQQTIRLPEDKLSDLMTLLTDWKQKKKCTKRELLSLIGSLSFACKVVKPGRIFLRRLINLSTSVTCLDHHITLNADSRADIDWWCQFLPSWNGVCFIQSELVTSAAMSLYTDASGLGCGGYYGPLWFSLAWPDEYHANLYVGVQELFAIVVATFTWGHEWRDQQILFFTDNSSIVHVWRTGSSSDPALMKLVRVLFLFSARLNINILMKHIPGYANGGADALSRLQVQRFRRLHPGSSPHPSIVPDTVWTILT